MSAAHPLMTSGEVCEAFRVSPMTVTRWRQAGKVTAITMPGGRNVRYLRAELQAFMAGQPLTPEQVTELRERLLDGAP